MQVRLKVLQGSHAGKEINVPAPKFLIGRDADCHLRPQSDAVSRHHCVINLTENEAVVQDLKSRNGTYVNGERVGEDAVLLHGDLLRIGPLEFEVLVEQTVSKPKRPKVTDIKEAVARTAGGSNVPAATELDEVTQWLEEADSEEVQRRHVTAETRHFRLDETTAPMEAPNPAATADTKTLPPELKRPEKKQPGKLPPRPTTTKENSREAAADMLKKFFNRR